MTLNWRVCSRARLSRDARFDGKFFIGVRTSGVYCRPICPARTAKESNVRYFSSAAAAAEAGFRPCLRCRPECSPGTPAWLGTPNTVARALRLIDEGGLEDGGVEALAERLGIGSRHLRRLFLRHLGATPSAVAQTRRLHFAKKLIDETMLPMSQIAWRPASVVCAVLTRQFRRRIIALPRKSVEMPIKRRCRRKISTNSTCVFGHPITGRECWRFWRRGRRRVSRLWSREAYRRSIALNGTCGYFEISPDTDSNSLIARIQFADPRWLFVIVERIRAMFDLNADWLDIAQTLSSDPALSKYIEAAPGLRVPGSWDGFELATRAIVGQQITVQGATTLTGRIVKLFGRSYPQRWG